MKVIIREKADQDLDAIFTRRTGRSKCSTSSMAPGAEGIRADAAMEECLNNRSQVGF
jgi:hypothetical protein